jgi:hypothetical protein
MSSWELDICGMGESMCVAGVAWNEGVIEQVGGASNEWVKLGVEAKS